MFAQAYKKVSSFTFPLITSMRLFDGNVKCGMATFVVINPDGWIMTAAHVLNSMMLFHEHQPQVEKYRREVAEISSIESISDGERKRRLRLLRPNPAWITDHSNWWGQDGFVVREFNVLAEADFAVGRIEGWKSDMIDHYPAFKDPSLMEVGTSLCKLGYPFHDVAATFSDEKGGFILGDGALPAPRFPIEGIYTRNQLVDMGPGRAPMKFVETSSPGLRGQSGGPIFDRFGRVWALQSRTDHLPLGFNPSVEVGAKRIEEHQFLNVGLGTHCETIVSFLREKGITFELEKE